MSDQLRVLSGRLHGPCRCAQSGHEPSGFRDRRRTMAGWRGRDAREARAAGRPEHESRVLRVQGRLDPGDNAGPGTCQAAGAAGPFRHVAQQVPCVVLLAEETAVNRRAPSMPLGVRRKRDRCEQRIRPPAVGEDPGERLVAVQERVADQNRAEQRNQRQHEAAREGVLKPLSHDHPDAQYPVPQDRVGERDGKQEEQQHDEGVGNPRHQEVVERRIQGRSPRRTNLTSAGSVPAAPPARSTRSRRFSLRSVRRT